MPTSSVKLPAARRIDPASLRRLAGASSARRPATVPPAAMTMQDVERGGYTVFHGDVLDLGRFSRSHPGGAFLGQLAGRDGTIVLENAHAKTSAVRKMLARFRVGRFEEATRDPIEADVLALRAELHREGAFDYPVQRLVYDVVRWVVLLGSGLAVARWSHLASFALVLAGTIDVVWWIHDAGHDAVFTSEQRARTVIDWLGALVLGMPQQGYHYGVHRLHHGFTNVLGVDEALETGPLSWTEERAQRKPAIFRRGRLEQWFLGVIPAAGPALLYRAVVHAAKKRQYALLAFVAARWVAVVAGALALRSPALIFAPWCAGSVLAFMAGLNHFHLPMSAVAPASHVRGIFERTQNIRAGLFWHWLSGGLDLHVEHHLFPGIASWRYRAIAPRVRAIAIRHGAPYRTASRTGAVANLVRKLLAPLSGSETTPRSSLATRVETAAAVLVRGAAIFLPVLVAFGVLRGGLATFAGFFVVFGFLSAVELFLHASRIGAHARPGDTEPPVLGRWPRAQLWVYAVGHLAVFPLVLGLVARGRLSALETLGAGLSLACMGGTVGGLGGHELMHKHARVEKLLGIALYATASYGHFVASHIGGHHVNVGLREDWGTSRRGETIYGFLYRAVVHGLVGAFRIEGAKQLRKGKARFGIGNFVVRYGIFTAVLWTSLGLLGGMATLGFFLAVSAVTIAFMELFNYISHYALERPAGQRAHDPEHHTWESNNKVVNWFIFNAGMHGHHHKKPAHGFERLTLFHHQDYIPHGIALMAVISFVPPLYLRTMERILGRVADSAPSQPRGDGPPELQRRG